MLTKKKRYLVSILFVSDVLFALHYLLLGGYSGAAIIMVDAIYLIATFILEKYKKNKYVPYATIVSMCLIVLLTAKLWQGPISLLPMFAILFFLLGIMFKNMVIVKLGSIIRNTLNLIYMILLSSVLGAILQVCLITSSLIGMIISIKYLKDKNLKLNI